VAEWQFCNYEWHGWYDHELGLHERRPAAPSSSTSLQNLHFRSPSFHGRPPCGFSRFWLIFTVFMHIWQHPLRVLRLEFVFLLGQFVLWVLLTWNNTHSWGFRIYIWQHRFAFHLSFEISTFALKLRFQIW